MSSGSPADAKPDLPLHVEARGRGSPVVFLHGLGANSFTWRRHAADLAADHRVLLVDLKGFGRAPKPDDDAYGPLDQAELVARLVVEGDHRDVTLVGHSLGGGVALLTALLLRDRGEGHRLARIVDANGPAYPQPMPFFIGLARRGPAARLVFRLLPKGWLIRTALRSVVHDPESVTDSQVEAYASPLREVAGRRALLRSATRLLPPDVDRWADRYSEIDVPVLLVWGRDDRVVPLWVAERLDAELPRSRLVVLEECGHITPEEKPEETLALLRSFLGETADTQAL